MRRIFTLCAMILGFASVSRAADLQIPTGYYLGTSSSTPNANGYYYKMLWSTNNPTTDMLVAWFNSDDELYGIIIQNSTRPGFVMPTTMFSPDFVSYDNCGPYAGYSKRILTYGGISRIDYKDANGKLYCSLKYTP